MSRRSASWGDYDGDGDPDLWISNHTLQPSLYLNEVDQNGLFAEIASGLVVDFGDSHGSQWADIDLLPTRPSLEGPRLGADS